MARKSKRWAEVIGTIAASVATLGIGHYLIDWLKASGKWPRAKQLEASGDMGCDSCVGEDPIVEAGKGL